MNTLVWKILKTICRSGFVRDHLPDKLYLIWQWKCLMKYDFDWDHPQTLNEKIMWLKLHDRKPLYTTLVDKLKSKEWVKEHYGEKIIIPTLAVYRSVEEIDFDQLPNQFVLKCNHDSGNVFICQDKSSGVFLDKHMHEHDLSYVKRELALGLKHNFYLNSREWPYKNVPPRIIAEKLLVQKDGKMPNDYKLFFINGEFQFVYVSYDRFGVNDRCIFDKDWKRMPFVWVEPDVYRSGINTSDVSKPESFQEMIEFGTKMAVPFKCVRVDCYDVDGKMFMGEITPFHSAGYARFFPDEYDLFYGQKIDLSDIQ